MKTVPMDLHIDNGAGKGKLASGRWVSDPEYRAMKAVEKAARNLPVPSFALVKALAKLDKVRGKK